MLGRTLSGNCDVSREFNCFGKREVPRELPCPGIFLGITDRHPSVSKSNRLHVDIFQFFLNQLKDHYIREFGTFSAFWDSYKYKNMDKITQILENVVRCKYFEAGVHIKKPTKNSYQDGLGRMTQTLNHVVVVHILIWDKSPGGALNVKTRNHVSAF